MPKSQMLCIAYTGEAYLIVTVGSSEGPSLSWCMLTVSLADLKPVLQHSYRTLPQGKTRMRREAGYKTETVLVRPEIEGSRVSRVCEVETKGKMLWRGSQAGM